MTDSADDFSWMEAPVQAAKKPCKRPVRKPAKVKAKTRAKKGERNTRVESAKKIDHENIRGKAMAAAVQGRKRIWACDGEYVYFRRKSCLGPDGRTDGSGNVHRAITRHDGFIAKGDYEYVTTQDDVEICKVNPQSALYRKGQYLGTMSNGMVQRAIVIAACKRDWVTYTDALEELAGRIKSQWQDPGTAKKAWDEFLAYIDVQIMQRHGPSPQECSAGLQQVRQARGEGKGRLIILGS